MIFTSQTFVGFFVVVFAAHWLLPRKSWQNVLLLAASCFFYGYIHPWFCLLIAFSSLLDF